MTTDRVSVCGLASHLLLSAMIIIVLGSCSDPTRPGENPRVTFSYDILASETFEATGVPILDSTNIPLRADYVLAVTLSGDSVGLIAHDATDTPEGTMLTMARFPARVGQYPLEGKLGGILHLRHRWTPYEFGSAAAYFLDEGTVTVTTVSPNGIRGRFHATGRIIGPSQGPPWNTVSITGGRFDIPIDPPGAEARGCWMFSC